MAKAQHYCITCGTHFGGPPNYVSPEEHVDIAHGGVVAEIFEGGNFKDYEESRNFRVE